MIARQILWHSFSSFFFNASYQLSLALETNGFGKIFNIFKYYAFNNKKKEVKTFPQKNKFKIQIIRFDCHSHKLNSHFLSFKRKN